MNRACALYVTAVIAIACVVMALALMFWHCTNSTRYTSYLILILVASAWKIRLPKMRGTYSFGSLGGLLGILVFTLPETLVAGCAAVFVQTVIRSKTKPKLVQVAFNMGNIVLTIALSFGAARLSTAVTGAYPAAVLAITACVYFVSNSFMTSVVLALVESKPLISVWQEWYVWSFPYYLIGTVAIGLLPIAGQSFSPESIVILLIAIYLVHFYCGLTQSGMSARMAAIQSKQLNR